MSEVDKVYELKVLKMVVNRYLDETILSKEKSQKTLEANRDWVVWDLATRIYSQSGHKVEFSTVRDIVNSRIATMKHQLATENERMAEQARRAAEEKVRQATAEEARLRDEINRALAELGGDESKAKVLIRVRKIISEQLSVDEREVTLDSHISNDLGADELDTVELVMALEEELDIEIPDNMLGSVEKWPPSFSYSSLGDSEPVACTVRELLNFIHGKVSP